MVTMNNANTKIVIIIFKLPSSKAGPSDFVCLLLNGTSALFRPLVPRIVEVVHIRYVKND